MDDYYKVIKLSTPNFWNKEWTHAVCQVGCATPTFSGTEDFCRDMCASLNRERRLRNLKEKESKNG